MLYVISLGKVVLAARLDEQESLKLIRDSTSFPEFFEEDRLAEGDTPNEKIHRYLNPLTQKWVTSGYKITTVPNPMTHRAATDILKEALETIVPGNGTEHDVVGFEWGVKIREASGFERILDPDPLELTARNRLERYRESWPNARLVRRPVHNEPWEEVVDDI
jgi:hypothetical protein